VVHPAWQKGQFGTVSDLAAALAGHAPHDDRRRRDTGFAFLL